MSCASGYNLVNDGLYALLDVANPKCVDATLPIDTNTRLKNLINPTIEFAPNDIAFGNMTFTQSGGQVVYDQNGLNGGEPCWVSTTTIPQVQNYTFMMWFKLNYGASFQRGENIYGGGFELNTSFYLVPSGTSPNSGILRYDQQSANTYGWNSPIGATDGTWHCLTSVDSGGDGAHSTKVYLDGIYKGMTTSNASHVVPTGPRRMIWGGWANTYGNFNGQSSLYVFYTRDLTDDEVMQNYIATKGRFNL